MEERGGGGSAWEDNSCVAREWGGRGVLGAHQAANNGGNAVSDAELDMEDPEIQATVSVLVSVFVSVSVSVSVSVWHITFVFV